MAALARVGIAAAIAACGSERAVEPSAGAISDSLATADSVGVPDSLRAPDSLPIPDSLAVPDSLPPADSLPPPDSLPPTDSLTPPAPDTPPPASITGITFGPYALWKGDRVEWGPGPFTGSINYTDPDGIIGQIAAARAMKQRLVLAMTGGGYDQFRTRKKFDFAKWKRRMNRYERHEIKAAVARGVADGTILMNNIMDEPNVKKWGGVMTKPLLDNMARHVKAIFPTLPVSVAVIHTWRSHERYRVVDAIITQYSWYMGGITDYRDQALQQGRRDGVAVAFALNILDGGVQSWRTRSCPTGVTGGRGTKGKNHPACRMTANQVRNWGQTLGTAGCAFFMWRFDEDFMSKSSNQKAFQDIGSKLRQVSRRGCRRS